MRDGLEWHVASRTNGVARGECDLDQKSAVDDVERRRTGRDGGVADACVRGTIDTVGGRESCGRRDRCGSSRGTRFERITRRGVHAVIDRLGMVTVVVVAVVIRHRGQRVRVGRQHANVAERREQRDEHDEQGEDASNHAATD